MATATERAIQAVSTVAKRLGLTNFMPVVLAGYSNTLIRLAPHPIVARVATATSVSRDIGAVMAHEIAMAQNLAEKSAPSVRVSALLPPGPHTELGLHLSFWEYADVQTERPTPAQTGAMLRQLHDMLDHVSAAALQPLSPVHTAAAIAAGPRSDRLDTDSCRLVRTMFERTLNNICNLTAAHRPLHGDAHHGNLWVTPGGMIWGDLEDVCTGPIEWDLAALTASSIVLGRGRAAAEALAAYGKPYDSARLDVLIVARTLQAVAWSLVALDSIDQNPRLLARLAWLRERA